VNFDIDLTAIQRQAILTRRTAIAGSATTEQLRVLMLDTLNLLLDDPQYTANDRQFSREIDPTTGKPREPEYAHEFMMQNDYDYFSTWAYDNSENFRTQVADDNLVMDSVARGREKHAYFETDPDIVDRSLLRNGLRERLEGEEWPAPVIGSNAPDAIISMPKIVVVNTASLGGFY
jgi:hypothetical protein